MSNYKNIFEVDGDKLATLLIDDSGFRFSSKKLLDEDDFNSNWGKSMTFATQTKINFDKIKSIGKEEKEQKILIKYTWHLLIPSEVSFSFVDNKDYDVFFEQLQRVYYFKKGTIVLSPLKANIRYLLGLSLAVFGTIIFYNWAQDIYNGKVSTSQSSKAKLFEMLLRSIGDKGVLLIGIFISLFIIFKMWQRIKNPPRLVKFKPPNSL